MALQNKTNMNGDKKITIILTIALIIVSILDIYLFFKLDETKIIEVNYLNLKNRTDTLEAYYDELYNQYASIIDDYENIQETHSELTRQNYLLQKELEDILNHNKQMIIEENKNLNLNSNLNTTLIYSLPASGYVEINLSSSSDIYLWVGSSVVDEIYYSRFPPFPETASEISFKVPVSPTLYLYIYNPGENQAEMMLSILLVY